MGIALGCIGMSRDDFCRCTPCEFHEAWRMWAEHRQDTERGAWERMRMLGLIFIQPLSKKGITAHELLPLPWDEEGKDDKKQKAVSREDFNKRFEAAKKRNHLK